LQIEQRKLPQDIQKVKKDYKRVFSSFLNDQSNHKLRNINWRW
jgi:hypothetical protein